MVGNQKELPQDIEEYLRSGNRRSAAEKSYRSEANIQFRVNQFGLETNPTGRRPPSPSFRSTAARMRLEGHAVDYIARILSRYSPTNIWRFLKHTRERTTGLHAVAAIIYNDQGQILVHNEKYPNNIYHKYEGSTSIQMTWRGRGESDQVALTRLLEREVWAGTPIGKNGVQNYVNPIERHPVGNFMVVDVDVALYAFQITNLGLHTPINSFKVTDIHWALPQDLAGNPQIRFRTGAEEMILFAQGKFDGRLDPTSQLHFSWLNLDLFKFFNISP